MSKNELPISLCGIQVSLLEAEFISGGKISRDIPFDNRNDFIFLWGNDSLVVRVSTYNERLACTGNTKGIRRPVTIIISEAESGSTLAMKSAYVCYGSNQLSSELLTRVCVDYDDIKFGANYKIAVIDNGTGLELGRKPLRFFRTYDHLSRHISGTYKSACAGIISGLGDTLLRAFKAEDNDLAYVKFDMAVPNLNHNTVLPEVEVRIHYADGSIDNAFLQPEIDGCDLLGERHVSFKMAIDTTPECLGIAYAELVCLDYPVAGFVFSTAHPTVKGAWPASCMDTLEDYIPELAAERFEREINAGVPAATPAPSIIEDDSFDQMVDAFIESEKQALADEGINVDDIDNDCQPEDEEPMPPSITIQPSALESLDNLTGLTAVKEKLRAYEKFVIFNNMRRSSGLPTLDLPLHAMFCGSPGTGKTTVAKRMGSMLKQAGVLSKGHVVVKERATLLGKYYSMEESNTLKAIQEAQGGILLIDEAYQLYQPNDPRDPGKFVIEALMTALADESKRDWMLILAGYTDEMMKMFEMNPGLKSRIPESNIYVFDDFSEGELMEIAENYLQRTGYTLTSEAKSALNSRLSVDYRGRDKSFGNARHVLNMIQTEILPAMASRVVSAERCDAEALCQIQACDIPRPSAPASAPRPRIGFRA